jgi:Mrp family chromosome partitioning ATPase/predicted Fe-Mo cluster-binding NifX family protein
MGESGCQHSAQKQSDTVLNQKISKIAHTFVVMSGKGGVGKSTVAVNLAISLATHGFRTGILDVDLHGPSVPKMLGLSSERLGYIGEDIAPVEILENLKVVSMGFMLQGDDDAVIMRGPMKAGLVRQFLENVTWGNLDCLVVDCPPGTGDEPLSVAQLLNTKTSSAIIVTTPQQMATIDVEKSISFCRQLDLPISGIIENMSGFVCPHCHTGTDIFSSGGGRELAERFATAFLGSIPLDPDIVKSGDSERPYLQSFHGTETSVRFARIVDQLQLLHLIKEDVPDCCTIIQSPLKKESVMRFAVPTNNKKLCAHFGHCAEFAIIDVENNAIFAESYITPPPHEPGLLPGWLHERGVDQIIAGGMGQKAQQLFTERNVNVTTGAMGELPCDVVQDYLNGTLVTGANTCDH